MHKPLPAHLFGNTLHKFLVFLELCVEVMAPLVLLVQFQTLAHLFQCFVGLANLVLQLTQQEVCLDVVVLKLRRAPVNAITT